MNQLVDISKKWEAQAAKAAAEVPATGGTFLSTKGGILKFGDEVMSGNQACVIILDAILENTCYEGKFDADNPAPPRCYAFARTDPESMKAMGPHPSMELFPDYFIPQSEDCASCPLNEYGSGDTGRGKACQNRARLALLPAGFYEAKKGSRDFDLEIFNDPAHFKTADIAHIKLPVLSVKNYFKFVSDVAAAHRRPPHGVIARIFLEQDEKAQFKVHFEMLEEVPDELAEIVMARNEEAMVQKIGGYQPPQEKDKKQEKPGSLRGLRRS